MDTGGHDLRSHIHEPQVADAFEQLDGALVLDQAEVDVVNGERYAGLVVQRA